MRAVVHPGPACGSVQAPASKSVAHRAVLAAALAEGETVLEGVSPSADLSATLAAARAFGAAVRPLAPDAWQMRGVPLPQAPSGPVDCGESGSTLRFLIPLLALTGAEVTLTGRGRLPQAKQGVDVQFIDKLGSAFQGKRRFAHLDDGGVIVPGGVELGQAADHPEIEPLIMRGGGHNAGRLKFLRQKITLVKGKSLLIEGNLLVLPGSLLGLLAERFKAGNV